MADHATYPSLRDKVVVITGGAEGIGAAGVRIFANQGSEVAILDIAADSANTLIEGIQSNATELTRIPTFYQCDVTDLDILKSTADKVLADHNGKVDILINNAAFAGGDARVSTPDVTPEAWDLNINVNLRHQFFLTQYLIPSMKTARSGSIINMGSITWRIPATGIPIYTTCKAAILGLTRTLARELGEYNIRVNSVMPGSIATDRQIKEVLTEEYEKYTLENQSLKRVLTPDEVARVVVFLASDDASAVTGASWCVDGGWVMDP